MDNLNKMLEYLENIIDVDKCSEILKEEENVLNYKPMEKINVRVLYNPCMKAYGMQEMHESIEKMMYNELVSCVPHIQSGTGIPMIRANYGVGTLPSLFGLSCKILNNNMPWVEHVTKDQVKEIISKGIPNLDTGFGRRLTLTHEFYQEKLEKYPKCRDFIKIYHPDFQGPLDVAHLIYGSDIYMDMYDEPELVHELLELVTDTYIEIMKRTKSGKILRRISYNRSDQIPGRTTYQNCSHDIRFSTHPPVVMLSYLFLLRIEVHDIITVVEGIRYRLTPDEIRSLLVGVYQL